MKVCIMPMPDGVAIFDTFGNPKTVYLRASELGDLIRWLNEERKGFIEDELKK
jgi:hypothetical protein